MGPVFELLQRLAGIDVIIVQTLGYQDGVCDAEVNSQRDDRRHQLRPDRANEVSRVTYHPDKEKY